MYQHAHVGPPDATGVQVGPVALSLRWNVHRAASLDASLSEVRDMGFTNIELCGVTERDADSWPELSARWSITATSIHAPCPDRIQDGRRVPGDWLLHDDPMLREAALDGAVRTIRYSESVGVPLVVFHLGTLDLADLYRDLVRAAGERGADESGYRHAVDSYRRARDAEARRRRPWLLNAVDAMVSASDGRVQVCVENRYRFDQVPNLDDAVLLLDRYPPGSPLSYWHDTGHEAAQAFLGLDQPELLHTAQQRLAGLHVHDCVGTDDHRPPGEGEYPFHRLRHLLSPVLPLVLELDPASAPARVVASRGVLVDALTETAQDTRSRTR
jgi:sugar phosphate isomerase/epimerase